MTGKESREKFGITAVKGEILKPQEIASIMRMSKRWVQKHMHDGTFPIPWYPLGAKGRGVDSVDLNNYLKRIRAEVGTAQLSDKAIKKLQEEVN